GRGVRDRGPGDRLVGRPALAQQPLGLGVDRGDRLLEVQRLAERLPDVPVDAQVDLAAVSLRVEEVDAVGVPWVTSCWTGTPSSLKRWWYACSASTESTRQEIWCGSFAPGGAVRPRCRTNSWCSASGCALKKTMPCSSSSSVTVRPITRS